MTTPGMDTLVVLHLAAVDPGEGGNAAPLECAVEGISEVLNVADRGLADRVALLSTLEELTREGVVEERVERVERRETEQTVYRLTDDGREVADTYRERFRDRRIRVRNGDDREIPLSAADEYLAEPALPRALARLTADDVLHLDRPGAQFVGRERELATLTEALEAIEAGEGRTMLIAGEPGIGKTTLVADAFAEHAREAGAAFVLARARAEPGAPYAAFEDVLDAVAADPNPLDDDHDGPEPADPAEYETRRTAMFDAVSEQLAAAAADDPLVVAVDDLHQAGASTLALFEHLVDDPPPRTLFVGTYRPGGVPETHPIADLRDQFGGDGARSSHHSLSPLGRDETRRLVQWQVDRPDVPEAFVDLLYDRTGGNPLFVEEITARTVDAGIADPERGVFPTDRDELLQPETVEQVVDARLDVLDEDTRSVLGLAALIGQTIPVDVLRRATDRSAAELWTHLDVLVDARMLERPDDETLAFTSGLVRDSIVEGLSPATERSLHGRIADAYAAGSGDDPDRHAAIANHRQRADDLERAFEAYCRAGERTMSVYAAQTALSTFETALSIARDELDRPDDDGTVLTVLEGIADAYRLLDDYEQSDRYYQFIAERATDADRRRTVATDRAELWRDRGNVEKALTILENVREAVGLDDTRPSVRLLHAQGEVHSKREEYTDAETCFDRARSLAERIGDEELVRTNRNSRDFIDMERGTVDEETIETWEATVEEARALEDGRYLADMLSNLGIACIHFGDVDRAREAILESIDVYEELGLEMQVCDSRNTLGAALTTVCEWDAAVEQYEQALETAREVGNERVISFTHNNVATVSRFRGELWRAADHYDSAIEAAESIDNRHIRVEQVIALARVVLFRGELDRVRRLAGQARENALELDHTPEAGHASALLGHVRRHGGELTSALDACQRAIELVDEDDERAVPKREAASYRALARARLARDEPERALEAAEAARSAAANAMLDARRIRTRALLGACHRECGDLEIADEHLDAAMEAARDGDWAFLECLVDVELGLLDLARSRPEAARSRLERAQAAAEEMDATLLADRCRTALDGLSAG